MELNHVLEQIRAEDSLSLNTLFKRLEEGEKELYRILEKITTDNDIFLEAAFKHLEEKI